MSELDFINLTKSFKYSVNIRYDIGDFDKINSFIPTRKNLQLFRDVFGSFKKNPTSRARILIGAYGTGKSYFGMVLGSILSHKNYPEKFSPFLNKIGKFDKNLKEVIEKEIYTKPPYLIVMPSTEYKTFTQSMLNGLKKALENENISDEIFPSTNFKAVKDKIIQWKNDYPVTYKKFKRKLEKKRGITIKEFICSIDEFEKDFYDLFVKWYPDLTAGGDFDPFHKADVTNVFKEVNKEIRETGYQGIYILYDEFNKLLENNIEEFDNKTLQDFAEMASRSGEEEIHLFLISHKDLVQYTSDLTKNRTNEWKKIEERFKKMEAINYSNQIYDLIASVIDKESGKWNKFKEKNKNYINDYAQKSFELDIFPSFNYQEMKNKIVEGCYPLHPLVTHLLPKLAQRVAQNERTLFTFLSTKETNTLGEFVYKDHKKIFPLINLDNVYDYFEDLMQQELDFNNIYQAWSDAQIALQKVNNNEINKIKFIKSLAIIHAVNNFSEVSPSKEVIKFALKNDINEDEFNDIFNELIDKKIIIERKSLNQVTFFDGSEVDINELITDKISQNKSKFNPNYLLHYYFNPGPIYPKRYNDEYRMRRYFVANYIYPKEIFKVNDWEEYLKNFNDIGYVDGIVNYVIWENNYSKKEIIDEIKTIDNERVIFVISNIRLKLEGLLKRLDALLLLKKDKELLEQDRLVRKEIDVYLKDTKMSIENELDKKLLVSKDCLIYNAGENISKINNLSNMTSNICSRVFNKTPKINNELLVKNKITSPQKRARKKVVNELLYNGLNERLNIEGYGPEYLIYRSMFVNTEVIENKDNNSKFHSDFFKENNNISNLKEILLKIKYKIFSNSGKQISFGDLYETLRDKPYGIRLGIIPILIVIAGRIDNDIDYVIIKHNGEEREINAQLFEEINRYPNRYSIKKMSWNNNKEKYITFLDNLFNKYSTETNEDINRVEGVYTAIKKWLINLPNYAKETQEVSSNTKILRKIFLRQSNETKTIILDYIPNKLSNNYSETWNKKTTEELKEIFTDFYIELNNVYDELIRDLYIQIARKVFTNNKQETSYESEFKNSLIIWYDNLSKNTKHNTFKRKINSLLSLFENIKINNLDDREILQEMAKIITGFEPSDWDDNLKEKFIDELKAIKNKIENFDNNIEDKSESNNRVEFKLKDDNGNEITRSFKTQDLKGIAQVLEKQVRGAFQDVGENISDAEKQQIVVNVLKDIVKEKI